MSKDNEDKNTLDHIEYIEKRYKIFKFYKKFLASILNKSNYYVCLNKKGNINLLDYFKKIERIGSKSKFGDVYKLCLINKDILKKNENFKSSLITRNKNKIKLSKLLKGSCVSVKLIPLEEDSFYNKENTKYDVWREIKAMELVTKLVRKWNCQNFSMMYGYFVCNNCSYNNPELASSSKMCLLVVTELSHSDLKNWLIERDEIITKSKQSTDLMTGIRYTNLINEWYNIFFQIFSSIYLLQKKHQLIHNDLHWGNILIDKIKAGGYWVYIINGITYYLPNLGFIIKISDFGKCTSITNFQFNQKDMRDMNKILVNNKSVYQYNKSIDIKKISNIYNWINSSADIKNKEILPKEFYYLLQIIKNEPYITPIIVIKKYMIQFLHNKIGKKISEKDQKNMETNNKIIDYRVGEIVGFKNHDVLIYALVSKIVDVHVLLIINKDKHKEIIASMHDVYKFKNKVEQDLENKKYKYLKEKKLGVFIM